MEIAEETGWGAQFGGRHMALNARVIRMARHGGSCRQLTANSAVLFWVRPFKE